MLKRVLLLVMVICMMGIVSIPAVAACTYDWDGDTHCDMVLNSSEISAIRNYGPALWQHSWVHIPGSPYYYCNPGTGTMVVNGVRGCKYTMSFTKTETTTNSITVNGGIEAGVLQDKAKASAGFAWTNSTTVTTQAAYGTEAFCPEGKNGDWEWRKLFDRSEGYYYGKFYDMDYVWTSTGWHNHGFWREDVYRADPGITFITW